MRQDGVSRGGQRCTDFACYELEGWQSRGLPLFRSLIKSRPRLVLKASLTCCRCALSMEVMSYKGTRVRLSRDGSQRQSSTSMIFFSLVPNPFMALRSSYQTN